MLLPLTQVNSLYMYRPASSDEGGGGEGGGGLGGGGLGEGGGGEGEGGGGEGGGGLGSGRLGEGPKSKHRVGLMHLFWPARSVPEKASVPMV